MADYLDDADRRFFHPDRDAERAIEFAIVLQRDAYRRLQQMDVYRWVEAKISVPAVAPEDRENGRGLGAVLQRPIGGTETITIRYNTALHRDSSLSPDGVIGMVNTVQRLGEGAVRALKVFGRQGGERAEEVDFFSDRLSADQKVEVGQDGRLPRHRRVQALRAQYKQWLDAGSLR